jgi:hypothetical protein
LPIIKEGKMKGAHIDEDGTVQTLKEFLKITNR